MRAAAAWALLGVYVALAAGAVALTVFQGASSDGLGALAFACFAGVGTLISLRSPDNAVGWLLLGIAIAFAAGETGASYVAEPSNPGRVAVAWVTSLTITVWFPLALVFLPLLFPHGRPPSPRWRVVLWLGVAGLLLGVCGSALTPGMLELRRSSGIENPLGVAGGLPEAASLLAAIVEAAAMVLAAASVVVRFRRARGAERQQLKWFAYTGVLTAACLFIAVLFGSVINDGATAGFSVIAVVAWLSGLVVLAFGLPAATGIAILKYRLYDIDLVIRRTLVYGALTALLAGAYLGSVLVLQLALSPGSDLAVALSTLAVAALFRPARTRVQAAVDHRFYRRRYDAAKTLDSFGARLRDEVDLDTLAADLRGAVAETVQPTHVSLWLRSS